MDENEQNGKPEIEPLKSYAKYSALGFQMIAIIGVFTFIGYKIDESAAHDTKWITAIFSLIGVFASLFIVIRSVKS